ncbi:MAG TPA: nicotinamide-nucleotide amidohydrolase family protein, partial [Desulfuromonadaceae bacterium]
DLVRARLGECVFSEGIETMDEALARLFRQSGQTLALAESCTGGMISRRITDIPGSSAYFLEGVVTYSNSAKERLLGVPAAILREKGAVSAECAEAMATGVRRAAGSGLGLAVTGIAGPDGGTPDKPVGTVFIALAGPDGCRTERFLFGRSRDEIRVMTAWTALDWLRRYLADLEIR